MRRRARVAHCVPNALVIAALLAAMLSACTTSGKSDRPARSGSGHPSIGSPPQPAPGDHSYRLTTSDGRVRSYVLHVPPAASGTRARALVIVLHGVNQTPAQIAEESGFDSAADAAGMYAVYPAGIDHSWQTGIDVTAADQQHVDDVAFVHELIAHLESTLPVDRSRVAAVGFSNGGLLAQLLGCRLPADLSAVVPIEATFISTVASGCAPSRAVNVVQFQGTADQTIPYDGGVPDGLPAGLRLLSAPQTVARWAALNRCEGTPGRSSQGHSVLLSFDRCADATSVLLYVLSGGDHSWPDPALIDANTVITDFVRLHPRH